MEDEIEFVSFDEEIHSIYAELRYWQGGDTEFDEWVNRYEESELKRVGMYQAGD